MSRKSVSHNRLIKGQLLLTPCFEYAGEISKIKGAKQVGEPREHGLIPVRRAAQVAVMPARPYPRLALRRELHLEYPPGHHAVVEHVLVLQVIAEGGAFEDQRGTSRRRRRWRRPRGSRRWWLRWSRGSHHSSHHSKRNAPAPPTIAAART